jgi:hypothetical protein
VPRVRRWLLLVPVFFVSLALLVAPATADPASDLSAAESRAVAAEADVEAARDRRDAARARYAAASRRAAPLATSARAARREAKDKKARLEDRQREARAEIARLETVRQEEDEEHDEEVANGFGIGIAALVAAAIALGWGRFRDSTLVVKLRRMPRGQALGLCLGGGFLVLVLGAGLGAGDGLVAALGMAIFCLGLILPAALLMARHAAKVQRGRANPVFGRDRLPNWVSRAAAALFLLLGLFGLLGAITADDSSPPPISAQLREEAEDPEASPAAGRLAEAETEAVKAGGKAAGPLARQRVAQAEVGQANRELGRTKRRLASARADVNRFSRQLAVLTAREEREDRRQAEREAEEALEAEEAEEEFFEEEEESSGCDPNYSPCVPAYPPDVDCAEVSGSVSVVGSDPHGLDADSDGIGCE